MGYVGTFFLWSFFIFGVLEFLKKIIYEINSKTKKQKGQGDVLLVVKNHEQVIEPILRTLDHYGIVVKVMDNGSTDSTAEIIKRLAKDLNIVNYLETNDNTVTESNNN